jgi:hypothetical protein
LHATSPQDQTQRQPIYLSLADVCERYGVSRPALRELRRLHGWRPYRCVLGDRRWYLRTADVDRVLAID